MLRGLLVLKARIPEPGPGLHPPHWDQRKTGEAPAQGHLPEKIEASLKMSERREVTGS